MNKRDKGKDKPRAPAQQAQQPQPVQGAEDQGWSAQASSAFNTMKRDRKGRNSIIKDETQNPSIDEARLTAGVVKLYEAVLKEPIPESMLRLIQQLGKTEGESGNGENQTENQEPK